MKNTKILTEEERAKLVKQFIKHNALHPGGTDSRTIGNRIRENFLKEYPTSRHTWSFFKDDSHENFEIIKEELLSNKSEVREFTKREQELDEYYFVHYNKLLLVAYSHAFAWNLGYKIDQGYITEEDDITDKVCDIINIYSDNFDTLITKLISELNIQDLIKYIYDKELDLIRKENHDIRFLVYSTTDIVKGICNSVISVELLQDDYITINYSAFGENMNEPLFDECRLTFSTNDDKINFLISDFDDIKSVYHDEKRKEFIYTILTMFFSITFNSLTTIMNYIDRPHNTKELADKEYVYKEDKINRSELRNAAIKYTKYRHTRTTNEYYPEERRSPRAHERKEHYRMQWVGSKKDGTRHQELRLVRRSTVNPWNDKMAYNDNIIGGNNNED